MNANLKGQTGNAFDKAYISMMIERRQGAIEMAYQAQASAKHEGIESLANGIVTCAKHLLHLEQPSQAKKYA